MRHRHIVSFKMALNVKNPNLIQISNFNLGFCLAFNLAVQYSGFERNKITRVVHNVAEVV